MRNPKYFFKWFKIKQAENLLIAEANSISRN